MLQTSRQVLRRLVRQRHGRGEAGPRRHEAEKNDPAAKMVSETRALTESAICVLRFRFAICVFEKRFPFGRLFSITTRYAETKLLTMNRKNNKFYFRLK